MKILFLMHQFYPTCQYGAETYAYHLGRGLQERGHQVHVFHRENHVPRDFGRNERLQEEDIDVDGLHVRRVFLNPRYGVSRGAFFRFLTTFYNPVVEQAFARYLDDFQPDLLHVHHLLYLSGGLIRIARQCGIPVVATLHDFWYFCSNAQLLRPDGQICEKNPGKVYCAACMKALYGGRIPDFLLPLGGPVFLWQERYLRRAMSRTDVLISPSNFLLEKYVQAGYPREKLLFLEYGIQNQDLAELARHREPHQPLRIGYIGSLTQHKGVHVLIQAFRQLPPDLATLDVYGSPGAFPEYSTWLSELAGDQPNIHLRGAFEHDQLGQVLQSLDVIVVTSLWYENSPVVIQEALSAGVPVITSRIGSLPEKVKEGVHGLLFEPGDVESLRQALLQVAENPGTLSGFMENLRSFSNDMEVHLEGVLQLYRQVWKRE